VVRPLAQLEQARSDGAPAVSQLVDNPEGWAIEYLAIDQAGAGQLIEAV
jgi:hypothetical protein